MTSPGGTTAAALRELEDAGLRAAFYDALEACRDRARDLARRADVMASRPVHDDESVWDEILTDYDHGPGHPLRPVRLDLTVALARSLGVLQRPGHHAPPAGRLRRHARARARPGLRPLRQARAPDEIMSRLGLRFGFGNGDNPVFDRMHETSALVTGATVQAAAAVWRAGRQHAVNLSGGLHHAMRDRASGFCVYDDPAVAIAWLLGAGRERVAYVDVDVHHGDGVQAAFYDDPRVLTISLHESGRTLFPGTGWPDEIGTGEGTGYAVNVALPAGTGDAGWLRAFDAVVPRCCRLPAAGDREPARLRHPPARPARAPDLHRRRPARPPTGGCRTRRHSARAAWVVLGGGGYELGQVVPRAWTHVLAEVTGAPVNGGDPAGLAPGGHGRLGGPAPDKLTDREPHGLAPAPSSAWARSDRHRARRIDRRHPSGGLPLPRPAAVTDPPAGLTRRSRRCGASCWTSRSAAGSLGGPSRGENVAKVRKKVFAFFGVRRRQPPGRPDRQAARIRRSRALAARGLHRPATGWVERAG